ncbi:hypothetical protein EV424DRAFT_1285855, partial [Suillus variegatus]
QINTFVDVILQYKHGPGIFGHCKAYYGTVEAQGRGILHCHMLIWITGNLSPQAMRDWISADAHFQDRVFKWLENVISCEFPADSEFHPECTADDANRPQREEGEPDPRLQRPPQVKEMDFDSFVRDFNDFLTRLAVECNWHVHNTTCFKNLGPGDIKGDETCHMQIDGTVQAETCIDPETGSIELRRWCARVNNYTDVILFLMQCNTDTQFIGSGEAAKAAAFYTSEYITKNDLPLHVGLKALNYAIKANYNDNVQQCTKDQSLITETINSMMGRQETSHQQVMSYLVGGGDYYTSHVFQTFKFYEFLNALSDFEMSVGEASCESMQYDAEVDLDDSPEE